MLSWCKLTAIVCKLLNIFFPDSLSVHLSSQIGRAQNVEIALIRQTDQAVFLVVGVRAGRERNDSNTPHLASGVGSQFVLAVRTEIRKSEHLDENNRKFISTLTEYFFPPYLELLF